MVNLHDTHQARGNGMTGYRFGASGGGGSIVSTADNNCAPNYARGADPAGEGGVEMMTNCYGLPSYCGWQQVAGVQDVAAGVAGVVTVTPTTSPYFEGKACYAFGIDPAAPGTNLRFSIGSVDVGGAPQLAISSVPTGGVAGNPELLSDVFNRSDEPVLISWAIFSTVALARQLTIDVFNLNAVGIRIFWQVWGNARDSLPPLREERPRVQPQPEPWPEPEPGPYVRPRPGPEPGPRLTGVPVQPQPQPPVFTARPTKKMILTGIPAMPKYPPEG